MRTVAFSWANQVLGRVPLALWQLPLWGLLAGFYTAWDNRPNFHFTAPVWPLVLLQLGFAVLLFNFLVYVLIPRWLMRGQPGRALAAGLGVLVAFRAWLTVGSHLADAWLPADSDLRSTLHDFYGQPLRIMLMDPLTLPRALVELQAHMLVPILISFLVYALIVDRRRLALERDRLRLELSYRKAQLQPRFLFQTLARLGALTRTRSPQAGEVVLHLADLLRYTLYETETDRVPLARELEFLADYLALEQLHYPPAAICYDFPEPPGGEHLAPLLLYPFLTQVFAEAPPEPAALQLRCAARVQAGCLYLVLTGTGLAEPATYATAPAITAAQRRLADRYPGAHTLTFTAASGELHVHLTVDLS